MSKNLTRKGLAFGALVALAGSVIAGVPAHADTTGPVTLVPNEGTTFNSILQSGITLKSELDPNLIGVEEAGSLAFLIENPDGKDITATFDTAGSLAEILKAESDTSFATTAISPALTNAQRLNGGTPVSSQTEGTTNKFLYVTGSADSGSSFSNASNQGAAEVQTITSVSLTNDGVYVLTLPGGTVLSYTADGSAAIGEIQTGLRADLDYASSGWTLTATGTTITITGTTEANKTGVVGLTIDAAANGTAAVSTEGSTDASHYNFGTTSSANTLVLAADAAVTTDVTLYVTSWLDADGDGQVDTFEKSSDREKVVLYAPGSVSATTKISYLVRDNSAFAVEVVYNNDINPFAVSAKTGAKLLRSGSVVNITDDASDADAADGDADDISAGAITATAVAYSTETAIGIAKNVITVGADTSGNATDFNYDQTLTPDDVVDFGSGVYSAQAYYNTTGSTWVAVGAASATVDLLNGINADVDTLDASVTETANLDFDGTSTVGVRTGTKSLAIDVQAQDGAVTLEKANLKVRATVSVTALTSGAVTVSGSADSLVKSGSTVAYGYTNTKGIATFTINNSVGTKGDIVAAKFEILGGDGVWKDAETVTSTWADASLATWTAKPGKYVSGANVTVKFVAKDQFGEVISIDDSAALSVVAVASIGGIEKPLTYSKTVAVVAGVAEFTFANFATAGSSAQLVAKLYAGAAAATPTVDPATISVNVYNSLATDKITVAESFANAITYKDFVSGDSTDATVAAKLTKVGYAAADYTTITGTVTNTNTVGQPGVAVELSAAGVLFKAGDIYATDKITAYANEYGSFSVDVFAHTVKAAGATVTITADGKTATTLLKTYLPDSINDENLVFGWTLPAVVVKNTTYAVTAKLTDKWGNPVAAKDAEGNADATNFAVQFQGTGSVEINSLGTAVYKDFGKDGTVTVFVRSVKDVAGPGSISATLGGNALYATGNGAATSTLGTVDASNLVDDTATAWDETKWASVLEKTIEVLDAAPIVVGTPVAAASGSTAKFYVSATAAAGKTVVVKVAGKFVKSFVGTAAKKVVAIAATKGSKAVTVFVGGKLALTKTVTVK